MAQEAKIKVSIDVEQAKRSMDDVNQRIERSRNLGADVASGIRKLASAAAAGVGLAAAGIEAMSGPGIPGLGLGAVRDVAGSVGRSVFGGDPLGQGSDLLRAHQKAVSQVEQLVSGGGDVSSDDLKRMIRDIRDQQYLPGERNARLARQAGGDVLREDIAQGDITTEAAKEFKAAAEQFERAVAGFQRLMGGGS